MTQKIFLVCGLSGAGKTTTSKVLAKTTGGVRLTSEDIIMEIFKKTSNQNQDKDFSNEEIETGYKEMASRGQTLLRSGSSVIFDGVFRSHEQRNIIKRLADGMGIEIIIILVTAPRSVVKERLKERLKMKKQPGGYRNYLELKKQFEPLKENHFIIDSSLNITDQLKMHNILS